MEKVCSVCGCVFEAKRSTAKYCSNRCRQRAFNYGKPVVPDGPPSLGGPATFDECVDALNEAIAVANRFGQLANTAPRKLRPGFLRISDGLVYLIKKEGWL
ncbi:MAG: hypothetical protein IJ111_02040 [Eggerthellaceae bacterium]|nr:hypothetical protein [Eggerthellaceae bacterium]